VISESKTVLHYASLAITRLFASQQLNYTLALTLASSVAQTDDKPQESGPASLFRLIALSLSLSLSLLKQLAL